MLSIEAPGAKKFIQAVVTAYADAPQYPSFDPLNSASVDDQPGFVPRRKEAITRYVITNGRDEAQDSHAFLGEWFTCQVLSSCLGEYGYSVDLARPLLESGRPGRHGIDIVIADCTAPAPEPLLGINVKLRRISDKKKMENHHFDPAIRAPAIHVSLGNWEVNTREQEAMDFRSWTHSLALPYAFQTGKIPYMRSLQDYVLQSIDRTLGMYLWKWDEYLNGTYFLNENQQCIVPPDKNDFALFDQKLREVSQLFTEMVT